MLQKISGKELKSNDVNKAEVEVWKLRWQQLHVSTRVSERNGVEIGVKVACAFMVMGGKQFDFVSASRGAHRIGIQTLGLCLIVYLGSRRYSGQHRI